jgi:hypothetical protein
MQPDDTFKQVKQKIARCMSISGMIAGRKFEENDIRMWKANSSYSKVDRIKDFIKYNDLDSEETFNKLKQQALTNNKEVEEGIEENTGVEFPGI